MTDKDTKIQNGFVISDLHLDTSRTDSSVESKIEEFAASSDFCVLNGDIFDFKWSTRESTKEAIDFAVNWVESLCKSRPHCRFYYILGNHDCLEDFVRQLDKINLDNFSYHSTHLLLDDKLFLHGDLPLNSDNPFKRLAVSKDDKKGGFLNNLYDLVIAFRIHKLIRFVMTPNYCVKKIMRSIRRYNPEFLNDVRHIYFGHTHNPFGAFLYEGVYFHNTGSAIKHLETNLLEVSYEKR